MQRLPMFLDDPAYTYVCQLDGTAYRWSFTWNERTKGWALDIAEENGLSIIRGIRLVCNWSLLGRKRDTRLPPGMLSCMSLDPDDDSDPQLEDLGRRVRLVYFDLNDLANIDTVELPAEPGSWQDVFGSNGPIVS